MAAKAETRIEPIKTEADYEAALAEVEALWGADPGTEAGDRLHVLMLLVEDYERHAYDVEAGKPDPIAIIEHIMDSNGYRPRDLGAVIGSRSAATMILKRQRPLSLEQIRRVSTAWNISADLLIAEYPLVA
jgi:HTH-type transcriptional regulator/antitoxin HigA